MFLNALDVLRGLPLRLISPAIQSTPWQPDVFQFLGNWDSHAVPDSPGRSPSETLNTGDGASGLAAKYLGTSERPKQVAAQFFT